MVSRRVKRNVPWWAKMAAKMVLARFPVGYGVWKRLGLFEHGRMNEPAFAFATFTKHFNNAGMDRWTGPFTVLELGPGDSLVSACAATAMGGSSSYLVDHGRYANQQVDSYRAFCAFLRDRDLPAPDLTGAKTIGDVLESCSATYLTNGLEDLRTIPSGSIDFVWSNAVLEHVRLAEFENVLQELRRIVSANGVASHTVDLRDHLGQGLNNLRFSRRFWESTLVAESGFYTNRIAFSSMIALFRDVGFRVELGKVDRWNRPPIAPSRLSRDVKRLAPDDLLVSGFDVVLRPGNEPGAPV